MNFLVNVNIDGYISVEANDKEYFGCIMYHNPDKELK